MSDQADTLRKIMQQRHAEPHGESRGHGKYSDVRPARIITIASGKGGVGKSCFAATLGTMLARNGYRVLLVDGDSGLANLDILLNVQPVATLEQVLDGSATLQEAVVGVEPNLWLIPAASGLIDFRQADTDTRARLIEMFEQFPWEMDFVLVDTGAGIQNNVLSLHSPEFESVVVLTPEPTSLTDAYGLIKMLRRQVGIRHANVIVNQVTDGREGTRVFQRLQGVASKFVDVQLDYLGHWQKDEKITEAVMKRKILLDLDMGALSVPSLQLLAKRFESKFFGQGDDTSLLMAARRVGPVSASPLRTTRHMDPQRAHIKCANGAETGYRDEPARLAPGNTAQFFRTLLGEVKA